MADNIKAAFHGAKMVDYTGTLHDFQQMPQFQSEFVSLIRDTKDGAKAVVIVDREIGAKSSSPKIVTDHINLTGDNPLVGPNNPVGERFPIVQGIYLDECWDNAEKVVVAGIKEGVKPTPEDMSLLQDIGANACSYNLVPSMLVAAHAGWKVLGIVIPEGVQLKDEHLSAIKKLTGAK